LRQLVGKVDFPGSALDKSHALRFSPAADAKGVNCRASLIQLVGGAERFHSDNQAWRGITMNMRTFLAGGAIAAALLLAACHKNDEASPNQVNAATELSNMADVNATDEMMNEDSGNQAVMNAG
jgi:hypothetical protein